MTKIEEIEKIAEMASKAAGESLSKISNTEVEIRNHEAKQADMIEVYKELINQGDKNYVVYSRIYESINGIAFILFRREDALKLVDLLNGESIGTTGIMKDIDRSAIKETFNIVVNKYMTEISHIEEKKMIVESPVFITADRMNEMVEKFTTRQEAGAEAVTFGLEMGIADHDIELEMYIVFD